MREALATLNAERPSSVLISYAYQQAISRLKYDPPYFILDSGAFSAWASGRPVDLHKYAEFAQSLMPRFPRMVAINLDVIPGEFGRASSTAEREDGMARSLENADYLRGKGFRLMEVFHQDEPFDFLDLLLSRRRPGELIGLSPRNDLSFQARADWLRGVLGYLVKRHGRGNIPPCHGLAATSAQVMEVFPFFSVDSTSWYVPLRYGLVAAPATPLLTVQEFFGRDGHIDCGAGRGHGGYAMHLPLRYAVQAWLRYERYVTELWARRGVVWPEEVP